LDLRGLEKESWPKIESAIRALRKDFAEKHPELSTSGRQGDTGPLEILRWIALLRLESLFSGGRKRSLDWLKKEVKKPPTKPNAQGVVEAATRAGLLSADGPEHKAFKMFIDNNENWKDAPKKLKRILFEPAAGPHT
jgi:hypothetical protein